MLLPCLGRQWGFRPQLGPALCQVSRPGAEGTKGEALDLEELTVKKHKSNSGLFFFKIYFEREREREQEHMSQRQKGSERESLGRLC